MSIATSPLFFPVYVLTVGAMAALLDVLARRLDGHCDLRAAAIAVECVLDFLIPAVCVLAAVVGPLILLCR